MLAFCLLVNKWTLFCVTTFPLVKLDSMLEHQWNLGLIYLSTNDWCLFCSLYHWIRVANTIAKNATSCNFRILLDKVKVIKMSVLCACIITCFQWTLWNSINSWYFQVGHDTADVPVLPSVQRPLHGPGHPQVRQHLPGHSLHHVHLHPGVPRSRWWGLLVLCFLQQITR